MKINLRNKYICVSSIPLVFIYGFCFLYSNHDICLWSSKRIYGTRYGIWRAIGQTDITAFNIVVGVLQKTTTQVPQWFWRLCQSDLQPSYLFIHPSIWTLDFNVRNLYKISFLYSWGGFFKRFFPNEMQ